MKGGGSRWLEPATTIPPPLPPSLSLMMLDLNTCHSLEELPKIGSLQSLIHLDISVWFFLEKMPKELASLSELKGFLIINNTYGSSSCRGYSASVVNTEDTVKRKDGAEKLEPVGVVSTGNMVKQHQTVETSKKPIKKLRSMLNGQSGELRQLPSVMRSF
ncbi:hypothetical protein CDL15_Pgr015837 [Punica granatum]|uniref:Uncharacterized protein n=1 Tax=Punica granatum TaxID=22663 RepID=A0A218XQK5_PUNGR|nr:hypothetical protein CDL15_Pgr015837 [Punica granatum]PKI34011.1 hypothetical protein CRG98_045629 [Punica granatum]